MRDENKRALRLGQAAVTGNAAGELEFTPRDAGQALGELARELGAQVLDDFKRPEFRAGFGVAMVTTALLARTRLPGIAVVLMSCMIGAGVEQLYGMALDIHDSVTADHPWAKLHVHEGNPACWGHAPGDFPLDCPDGRRNETGKI